MWTHFSGTLTLRSDDSRGRVAMVDGGYMSVYMGGVGRRWVRERVRLDTAATCGRQELRVDGGFVWARIAQSPPLMMLPLVGNV